MEALMWEALWCGDDEKLEEIFTTHPELMGEVDGIEGGPLRVAASAGRTFVVKIFVKLGAKIDTCTPSGTAMHAAAGGGHDEFIRELAHADPTLIDKATESGITPLFCAASNGHASTIETLVRLGSKSIDSPSGSGATPMHRAAFYGHVRAIETLVRLGSQAIDTPELYGDTPLHIAARKRYPLVIKTLVRLGSLAMNTKNKLGGTPLSEAVSSGSVEAVAMCIQLGSTSIDTPCLRNTTPMKLAAAYGFVEIVELLARFGSRFVDETYEIDIQVVMSVYSPYLKCLRTIFALSRIQTEPVQRNIQEHLDEEFVLNVRYRVYFAHSLVSKLLFSLKRNRRELFLNKNIC